MDDIVIGFIAVGIACVFVLELATQVRIRTLAGKMDELLKKAGK